MICKNKEKKKKVNGKKIYKIYITEKGEKIYRETQPLILKVWEESTKGITEEELLMCSKILQKITDNIKDKVNIQI